jgi:FkbM family methyltransferase
LLGQVVYPVFRRVDFRGKGRLRGVLPVPAEGTPVVRFPGDVRLRLDLRESLQRDFYFGLYDRFELELMARHLVGDMVDVGAHVGMYAIRAARELRGRGRVLAFEPNPPAREQLEHNVALNGCDNVVVLAAAAGAGAGRATLHVPASDDPSFSSLEGDRFAEGAPVEVEVTTVDDAVAARALRPSFVKVDVEGREVDVLRGTSKTVEEFRPVLLVEVNERSAAEAQQLLPGYRAERVTRRGLSSLAGGAGLFNALFTPDNAP